MPVTISSNVSGSGTFTLQNPASASNRTVTLPDATTTLVGTDATQTLSNKTIAGGAVTQATAQASTSGTFIDFTGIPSWAKRVTVILSGVSTGGSSPILIRLGTSGGVVATGYTSVASYNISTGTFLSSTFGFLINATNGFGSSIQHRGVMEIVNVTGNTWVATGDFLSSALGIIASAAGDVTLSGTLDRIRLTTNNGTDVFSAGTVNIMYGG